MAKAKNNAETIPGGLTEALTGIGGEAPTNGAAPAIRAGEPYVATVRIVGTADILFHRWNVEAVEEKGNAAKGSKAKKTDDVESYVYRTPDGGLARPRAARTSARASAGGMAAGTAIRAVARRVSVAMSVALGGGRPQPGLGQMLLQGDHHFDGARAARAFDQFVQGAHHLDREADAHRLVRLSGRTPSLRSLGHADSHSGIVPVGQDRPLY